MKSAGLQARSPQPLAARAAKGKYKDIFICRFQAAPVSLVSRRGSMPSALNAAPQRSSAGVSNRIFASASRSEPAVPGHLLVELAFAPAGIAERGDPLRRPAPFGDGAQDVDGAGHREQLARLAVDVQRVLSAPVGRMEDEAAPRLDRPAMMDRAVGRFAGIDVELAKQAAKTDPGALVADADTDRALLVMRTHRDHRPLESRVGHARHRQQQFAGEEGGWSIMVRAQWSGDPRDGQDLRRATRRA